MNNDNVTPIERGVRHVKVTHTMTVRARNADEATDLLAEWIADAPREVVGSSVVADDSRYQVVTQAGPADMFSSWVVDAETNQRVTDSTFARRRAQEIADALNLGGDGTSPTNRLTMWQAVLQSWLIHPDWTVEEHRAWLEDEGYDVTTLRRGTPEAVIARWISGFVLSHCRECGKATGCCEHTNR